MVQVGVPWAFRRGRAWLLALAIGAAGAWGEEPVPLFTAVGAGNGAGPPSARAAGTVEAPGLVRIDMAQLQQARRRAEQQRETRLLLNLDAGGVQAPPAHVVVERTTTTAWGYSLAGRVDGSPVGHMVLVVHGDLVAGTVWTSRGAFSLRSVGDGVYAIERASTRGLRLAPPRLPPADALRGGSGKEKKKAPPASADSDAATSEVDVLLLWNPAARALAGGLQRLRAKVDTMVTTANEAYRAGGVAQRVRLVGAAEIGYDQARVDHIEILPEADDGFLDEIHALRDAYAADVVTLLVEFEIGGVAILMAELNPAFARFAFNMVNITAPDTVFAHELGHSMGLQHDRYEALQGLPSDLPSGFKLALFPYSFGYVNQRAFDRRAACWHTIMAYPDQCWDAGFEEVQLPFFSHPGQRYPRGGDPLGTPVDRPAEGILGPAHAARSLNESRQTVAAFRDSAARCRYALVAGDIAGREITMPASGGRFALRVDAGADCAWRAHHQTPFLSVREGGSGSGPGEVVYDVEANPGLARVGVVSIAAETVGVRQEGAVAAAAVCGRSPGVRAAIVAVLDGRSCDSIDDFDLREVGEIELFGRQASALRAGDFEGLVNLWELTVIDGALDVSLLRGLGNLRRLTLLRNGIENIAPLASLGRLQELSLVGSRVMDLSPLRDLSGLQFLQLTSNRIVSLRPLATLTSLFSLQAGANAIADVSPLANLHSLVVLHLANNEIADIAPLLSMRQLLLVDLTGNPLSDEARDVHIPALQRRGVTVLFDEPEAPPRRPAWWWSFLREDS